MTSSSSTLKATNLKWMVMLVLLDVAMLLMFVAPELVSESRAAILRAAIVPALPILVLLLSALLSHEAKARLVYWKIKNPLPGSQAFTKHAPRDARIDMMALKKNIGQLPTEPREQNARWYTLYRAARVDPAVVDAHRVYLLFRDIAAISVLLLPTASAALWFAGSSVGGVLIAVAFFAVQYLLSAAAARNSGIRFICNVLAIHSATKITTASRK